MREDKLREFTATLKATEPAKYKVVKIEDPDELQERILDTWLKQF
jgi:hypothetical protein